MQIDRSRFLLLTASIAGGACSSNSSSSGGAVVVASPIVALPGAESSAAAPSRPAASGKPGQAAVVGGDDDKLAALDRAPVGSIDDGSMCEEGGPAPTGCSTLRAPGPQCESFSDTKVMCGKLARGLRPHVAEKAVDCIVAKSGKQSVCDFNLAQTCAVTAIRKGCVEPSTQAQCTSLVNHCGGTLQLRECQALLSSVTSKNRRSMISCMTEGCSIDYCAFEIE